MDRVQFDRVSKRYVLGEHVNAREALTAAGRRLVRRHRDDEQVLWPLRDVSFTVGDGEALGIVGRNGAGKSTVLKILAGITSPTRGASRTRGRVATLLEVGTGFHPELTGRENVFLNGAILGMSRRDTTRRFDQIVDFSGTERFLDTPIKRYSSGMQLRLAFAVAAHLEPDVLLVDEVLAVGDAEFQRKCVGRMAEAEEEGRTVVFVSHDLETLTRICRRSLWLDAGRIRHSGPTGEVVRTYLASGLSSHGSEETSVHSGPVSVRAVRVLSADGLPSTALMRDEPLHIQAEFAVREHVPGLDLALYVTTRGGVRVFDEALSDHGVERLPPGAYCADLAVPPLLNVGEFSVGLWIGTAQEDLVHEPAAGSFTLGGSGHDRPDRLLVLRLPLVVRPVPSVP
ncbi:ABC-2 type transport system ATP-binding protein/lipopolysaccharide transport system ATP-binding protein [Geodermatophilus bullaregiensis]|uniref:ABC transporter ATP-binding protein n=1 Tax=Geodermatophilus bullaregiensis TaxID=1564160 RepID=UPI00195D2E95|nr:ABC transporter ATP-binding protein [Geodermatophilus bullaregiensis]MBM7804173.1 ABC-2 type transport system ATP-binding protein/lipopolysaccharide transport system ATP-binding protein [Geodermatophilus bullaregiensis]